MCVLQAEMLSSYFQAYGLYFIIQNKRKGHYPLLFQKWFGRKESFSVFSVVFF